MPNSDRYTICGLVINNLGERWKRHRPCQAESLNPLPPVAHLTFGCTYVFLGKPNNRIDTAK